MGRLSGFKYREIIKRLKRLGFEFDRQAAGSHEIWFNSETGRYTTVTNHIFMIFFFSLRPPCLCGEIYNRQ
jgi:predicted RNA binding protein YcfA (HicA-like mRNA interferase family)